MVQFPATLHSFRILEETKTTERPIPLIRNNDGAETMQCVSPLHGRSFLIKQMKDNGRYVISKGNGLSYTTLIFMNTTKVTGDLWGVLYKENACRDFNIGKEVQQLGIKTNRMEYVIEITDITLHKADGNTFHPCLLQYDVECPYRISDAPFMSVSTLKSEIEKWQDFDVECHRFNYLIAAEILIKNLKVLHENHVMHNAVNPQNYTWALELLDFEASRTDKYPYSNKEYEKYVPLLENNEIIQTYQIIIYIAGILNEIVDFKKVDDIFSKYGYDLNLYKVL